MSDTRHYPHKAQNVFDAGSAAEDLTLLHVLGHPLQGSDVFSWESLSGGDWPFQRLADCLVVDCLHQVWETRHGGALGLREVLSCQASCAAVTAPIADPQSGNTSLSRLYNCVIAE